MPPLAAALDVLIIFLIAIGVVDSATLQNPSPCFNFLIDSGMSRKKIAPGAPVPSIGFAPLVNPNVSNKTLPCVD